MRILHVNDVANVASTLAAAQRLLGHEVDVRRLELAAGDRSTAVKLLALPRRLAEIGSVNRQVRAGAYDVVHIHYAYLGLAGILGRYRYLLHCHGTDVRSGLTDPVRGPLVRSALRHAGAVVVGTPDLLPLVSPLRPDAVFVPGPVDLSTFRQLPEPAGPFRVLLHAAVGAVKRTDVAFEAFRLLRERVPAARLTAIDGGGSAGSPPDLPGVDWIGRQPHGEVAGLIGRHHAVLGQFGIGSLGISELEALAVGRPVLCRFDYPSAYATPPPVLASTDPARLAAWLEELAEDPARRVALGEEGRAWVAANHDSLAVARRFDGLYPAVPAGKEPRWGTPPATR